MCKFLNVLLINKWLFAIVAFVLYLPVVYVLSKISIEYISIFITLISQITTVILFVFVKNPESKNQEFAVAVLPTFITLPIFPMLKCFKGNDYDWSLIDYLGDILIPTLFTSFMAMYDKNYNFCSNLKRFIFLNLCAIFAKNSN